MSRNAIESEFRTSKMADGSHFVKKNRVSIWNIQKYYWKWISDIQNGWAIMSKNSKINKVAYRSDMARNAIENEFRTSKMGAGDHFVKQFFQNPYWSKMARNVIKSEFGTSKMGTGGHFAKIKKKSFALIWNGQKCHRKWVSEIQNGRRQPFCKKNHKNKNCGIDLKW